MALLLAAAPQSQPATRPATAPALPVVVPEDMRKAVADLTHPDWKRREAAQQALAALHPEDSEELIRQLASNADDPETHQRLLAVLQQIADERAIGPTLITLRRQNADAGEVLRELFRKAGGEMAAEPANLFAADAEQPLPRIDVNWHRVPLWEAVREVCQKTKLHVRYVTDRMRPTFTAAAGFPSFGRETVVEGAMLLAASEIRPSTRRFGVPANEKFGVITMAVLTEPRLRATSGYVDIDAMEDEKGESLLPAPMVARRAATSPGQLRSVCNFQLTGSVPVTLPDASQRLAIFRGRVLLNIHTDMNKVEVKDVLKAEAVPCRAGEKRFTLDYVRSSGAGFEIKLTLYRDSMPPEEWAWFSYPYGKIKLLDAEGNELYPSSGSGGGDGIRNEFRMTFVRTRAGRPNTGEPAIFLWELPGPTREVVVPFEFRDMPLREE